MNFIYVEIIIVLLGIIIFILEINRNRNLSFIYILLSLLVIYLLFFNIRTWHINFNFYDFWKSLVVIITILSSIGIFIIIKDYRFEIISLNLMVLLGSLMVIICDHLLIIYLGLELQTFSLFILITKNRISLRGSEASLKYFILGALSSGFYLLGVSLIFSLGFSLSLKELYFSIGFDLYNIKIGIILVILSLFFKLALFPLHFWIPDIYEGSSWEVLSVISIIPKISVLVLITQLSYYSNILILSSIFSIIVGSLGALNQTKIKRLLAYSGISHMGFIILGVSLLSNKGFEIAYIYIFIYILTIISIFYLIFLSFPEKNFFIIELNNVYNLNKILSFTWVLIIFSLGGVPPLSGFISKWFILWNLFSNNYLLSSIIAILFSAIGVGYYLRIIKIIYFQSDPSYLNWKYILINKREENNLQIYILGGLVYFILFLILNPNPLILSFYMNFNYFI